MFDGINEAIGRINIMTANDINQILKLKSLTRTGRLDNIIELNYIDTHQLNKLCEFHFDQEVDISKDYKIIKQITPSDIINIIQFQMIEDYDAFTTILLEMDIIERLKK